MRIAAIADVHGNLDALRAVLAHIKRVSSPDLIVNLGDHVSGPLQPRETADLLMNTPQVAIRGNHDRQLLGASSEMGPVDRYAAEQLAEIHFSWLHGLNATAWIGNEIFLCHGTPLSDLEYLLEIPNDRASHPATAEQISDRSGGCTVPLILCGHSHIPRSFRTEDGRLIVNPGSVGIPVCIRDSWRSDQPEALSSYTRYALIDRTVDWHVEFIQVEYDWDKAVRLAAIRGYPDWAKALTGRFTN
jgi:putative phosphoesterase